jgi:uncharacterized protein (TIGR00730 family)
VELGQELLRRRVQLVYGGGNVGLMGILADTVLDGGGRVIGVIPHALAAREVAHHGVSELKIVESMHERKALMAELADAFIALPGGLGTLEEFCEVLTWAQLGLHRKPCGLLNVLGYYQPLREFFAQAVREGFLPTAHAQIVLSGETASELFDKMTEYRPPDVPKWIGREEV